MEGVLGDFQVVRQGGTYGLGGFLWKRFLEVLYICTPISSIPIRNAS